MKKIKLTDLKKEMMKLKKTDKNKANALMMLIDTIEKLAKEKNPINPNPDLFIVDGFKKYIKQVNDSLKNGVDVDDELQFLNELGKEILPKQMDETQLTHVIVEFVNDHPDCVLGEIMKYLKVNFKDQVDMSMASQIAKSILNKESK